MNFQPKKPLQTLSDFVTQLEAETSTFQTSDAIEIVAYNNFLLQPLTKEMFEGPEAIFFDFKQTSFVWLDKQNILKVATNILEVATNILEVAELAKKDNFGIYIKA